MDLPLVDGAFFIDNSTLELLTTCPRSLEYNRLFKRISAGAKPSLHFGSAIHLALEWRYKNCRNQPPDALEESEQVKVMADFFAKPENVPPEDDHRNLNWAVEIIKHYNQNYQIEPFNILVDKDDKPLVEMPFALHLFDAALNPGIYVPGGKDGAEPTKIHSIPVYYSGKVDLPVMWDNNIVVNDHKTSGVMGDFFFKEQRVSPQQIGYCWAFHQLTSQRPNAFCINTIGSRLPPQKPKKGMDAWWAENFFRHKEMLYDYQLDEWKRNTIALIEEFFWHYSRNFFPQKKKWCSGKYGLCGYYDVCDLPPTQRSLMLESTMFAENAWSPLKEPSQSLQ